MAYALVDVRHHVACSPGRSRVIAQVFDEGGDAVLRVHHPRLTVPPRGWLLTRGSFATFILDCQDCGPSAGMVDRAGLLDAVREARSTRRHVVYVTKPVPNAGIDE